MKQLLLTYSLKNEREFRNALLDRLAGKSLGEVVTDIHDELKSFKSETHPNLARQLKNYFLVFNEKEIKDVIESFILKRVDLEEISFNDEEVFVEGASPIEIIGIGIAIIGIAVAIYDWYDSNTGDFDPASMQEYTQDWQDFYNAQEINVASTSIVTDSDGKNYLIITMEDGNSYWKSINEMSSD